MIESSGRIIFGADTKAVGVLINNTGHHLKFSFRIWRKKIKLNTCGMNSAIIQDFMA